MAIYLLELEVDNLFWCFTFAPKQHAVSFEGKFPNFGEFLIKRRTGGEKTSSFLTFYLSNKKARKKIVDEPILKKKSFREHFRKIFCKKRQEPLETEDGRFQRND